MDTPIERKPGITRKHLYVIGGIAFVIAVVLYFIFRDTTSSMTVEKERLTIATVNRGEFNDYIRVIGQVMPNRIIYMDAVEGGRVEERLKEEGAMVKAGDVILRLSNPLLNIGIMQSEADLAYQENELRNTRISMEQERLRLKQERIGLNKDRLVKQRRYEQYSRLIKEQLIAEEDYRLAKEEYDAAKEQLDVIDERIRQDNIFRESQVNSLDENIRNMKQSLALVRERIENLKVKAPIDGQVGNLDAQIGQSIAAGEHIGQIITSDLKVQAQIDEHYVERVVPGLPADFTRDGVSYKLEVTKPYPEVKEGQFRTDLQFTAGRPLIGMLMFGNLVKEIGSNTFRLFDAASNSIMNAATIFLGLSVGATMTAEAFLNWTTIGIVIGGFLAFALSITGGIFFVKLVNLFSKKKINPLIGATGLSAVPMASRVANEIALKYDPKNHVLQYCMASNISGVIGSAVAAGVLISFLA